MALVSPTLAAQRVHRGADAYASGTADRSGPYYYGPRAGHEAYARSTEPTYAPWGNEALTPSQHIYNNGAYGQNLPYADRPYGDPDGW